jgi:hypothetical protein
MDLDLISFLGIPSVLVSTSTPVTECMLKYLVDICKEVIMTLTYCTKEDTRTRLCSSLDSISQLETNLCPITITLIKVIARRI